MWSVILIFLLCLIPALFYAATIYLTAPYKTLNIKSSLTYLLLGFVSCFILYFSPHMVILTGDYFWDKCLYVLFSISLFEEGSKLFAFKLFKNSHKIIHPIAIMFYVCMVSTGFAVVENVQYCFNYGVDVLFVRMVTAFIGHMLYGLVMGYFVALGELKSKGNSLLNIFLYKFKIRKVVYYTIGLLSAVFFHGLYDYNLEYHVGNENFNLLFILGIGMLVTYLMAKDLISIGTKKYL